MLTHRSFVLHAAGSSRAVRIVIQRGILHQSSKDKQEADGDEKVHGGDIRHSGQWRPGHAAEGGHGQHCGYSWRAQNKDKLLSGEALQ